MQVTEPKKGQGAKKRKTPFSILNVYSADKELIQARAKSEKIPIAELIHKLFSANPAQKEQFQK